MSKKTTHETAQEWVARVLDEHGPPPQRLVDHVNRLRREHAHELGKEGPSGLAAASRQR